MSSKPILKDRYQVEAKLGEGAFGDVYTALDLETNQTVAVKTIASHIMDEEEINRRFLREIEALRRLQHPNIVGYVDAFSAKKRAFLVMEYVAGGTLKDVIKEQGAFPDEHFKPVILGVIDAVADVHDIGIIHRDLKPENILMRSISEPAIADFGFAKLSDLASMTARDAVVGTLAYVPAEAFDAKILKDHRADIWSIGVIMFEMLTGRLPFAGDTEIDMAMNIMRSQPTALNTIRQDLPPAWNDIILHCLERDVRLRYQSMRELWNDLNNDTFSQGEGQAS